MTNQPSPASKADINPVPDELLEKLHAANDRFHKSKESLETAMDGSEYRHQERVNQAEEELVRAEHEVEEVERSISDNFNKSPREDA